MDISNEMSVKHLTTKLNLASSLLLQDLPFLSSLLSPLQEK